MTDNRLQVLVKRFNRFALLTVISVYVVILAGGIVRSSGSGMGCPDWPKCFGSWVPPTSEAQLPAFYERVYMEKRLAKNKKVASMLDKIGFHNTANLLLTDPSVFKEQPFNAVKTWIEYINRLAGVLIGLFIIIAFGLSLSLWNHDKIIAYLSALAVFVVGFEGWLGSIVVSANLMPFTITLHMLLAIVLVGVLFYVVARTRFTGIPKQYMIGYSKLSMLGWLVVLCSLLQVLLGTQVREHVDLLTELLGGHTGIIGRMGLSYKIHRSFSVGVSVLIVFYVNHIYKVGLNSELKFGSRLLLVILGLEIVSGICMAYFDIPAIFQPIHLTLGSILIGLALYMSIILGFVYKPTEK